MPTPTTGSQERPSSTNESIGVPYQFLAFVACLLFVGVLPLPYGYYTFMRIIACGCAGFLCYRAWAAHDRGIWMWLWGSVAILFNPIAPIHMTKEIWMATDFLAGVLFSYEARKIFIQKQRGIL
ncbi:MAG: DUF6804 family protein [Bdellovibrionales bacterium]